MKITSASLIFFSPTGTTRKILLEIAKGCEIKHHQLIDLSRPAIRNGILPEIEGDLVLIGVPVYEERIPRIIKSVLHKISGGNKPAVLVGVHGNVGGGIVLKELYDIAQKKDLCPAAAAFFVGEHSFANAEAPLAKGRPDQKDLEIAREFGRRIKEKLASITVLQESPQLQVPGKLPLMARVMPRDSAHLLTWEPAVDANKCSNCGACVLACPVEAIDRTTLKIYGRICLRCFACVKKCPVGARRIKFKKKLMVRTFLRWAGRHRKEPEIFL